MVKLQHDYAENLRFNGFGEAVLEPLPFGRIGDVGYYSGTGSYRRIANAFDHAV